MSGKKKVQISFRLFLAAVAITLVGLGGYRLKTIAPESIEVHCRHVYSDSLQQHLTEFINRSVNTTGLSRFNPVNFAKTLKNNFTFIKNILWVWETSGKAVITIEGVRPLFLVNDQFVMGNKKRLFPKSFFENVALNSLRSITLASSCMNGEEVSPVTYKFLQNIPDSYWDRYTVTCSGDHCVLSDSTNRLRLLVDENTLTNQRKLDVVQVWEQEARKSSNKYVTYDLRFENCVCARYVGGSYGEKNAR